MKKLMTRLALVTVGVGLVAGGATAATPEGGDLKKGVKLKWSGDLTSSGVYYNAWADDPSIECQPQAGNCDKFALNVIDGGEVLLKARLDSTAAQGNNGGAGIRIKLPDNSYVYQQGESGPDTDLTVKLKDAKPGKYEVTTVASFVCCGTSGYSETAEYGGAPAPAPVQPSQPAQPQPGQPVSPAPPQDFKVGAKVGKVSAKKAKKGKAISVKVSSSRSIERMTLILKKGSKKVGTATLAPFPGSAKMKVKLSKALKKGSYVLSVVGQDGNRTVAKNIKVKVTK